MSLPPLSLTLGQLISLGFKAGRVAQSSQASGSSLGWARTLSGPSQGLLSLLWELPHWQPQGTWRKVAGQRPRVPGLSGGWGLNSCQSDPNLSLMSHEC